MMIWNYKNSSTGEDNDKNTAAHKRRAAASLQSFKVWLRRFDKYVPSNFFPEKRILFIIIE